MTTATKSKKSSQKAKKEQTSFDLSKLPLLGEVVTWNSKPSSQKALVQALKDAGLDESAAKELSPRAAFQRAAKHMEEDRVVDLLSDVGGIATYQLTAKSLVKSHDGESTDEFEFRKHCKVFLNKNTGEIKCKSQPVKELFQSKLNEALEHRTAADVTFVLQRLFSSANVDLFPLRQSGGAYFVFNDHSNFVDQVETFINTIGGVLNRLPVPKGVAKAEKAIKNTVAEAIADLIGDHDRAIDALDVSCRKDTLERTAQKINETRVKIEAYASYLQDKSAELLEEVNKAQQKLVEKISTIAEERKALPPEKTPLEERVLAVLNGEPKNMKAIMEQAGLKDTCYDCLRKLAEKGLVEKSKDGYYLKKSE